MDHIFACGVQSDECVRATVKGALKAGLKATVLHGAHSTYDSNGKKAAEIESAIEEEVKAEGATVVPWETWQP